MSTALEVLPTLTIPTASINPSLEIETPRAESAKRKNMHELVRSRCHLYGRLSG